MSDRNWLLIQPLPLPEEIWSQGH